MRCGVPSSRSWGIIRAAGLGIAAKAGEHLFSIQWGVKMVQAVVVVNPQCTIVPMQRLTITGTVLHRNSMALGGRRLRSGEPYRDR